MKRLISILLAVMLVASCTVVASAYGWEDPDILTVDKAVAEYEALMGEEVATNRYYFLMPNGKNGDLGDDDSVDEVTGEPLGAYGKYAPTWFIPMSTGYAVTYTAGIYWCGSGVVDPEGWVGYLPSGSDFKVDPYVFYADVPKAVETIVWNNAVDGGSDNTQEIYYCTVQTADIPCHGYKPNESENYPDGIESFDNMIYVIDPDLTEIDEVSLKQTCYGEWYRYYGRGCYGFKKDGTVFDCSRDDHLDVHGNHIVDEIFGRCAGDVDDDDSVTVMDATLIQRHLARLEEFVYFQKQVSDVDSDGEVGVMDATIIQRHLAGY